jgi:hypothetical protein
MEIVSFLQSLWEIETIRGEMIIFNQFLSRWGSNESWFQAKPNQHNQLKLVQIPNIHCAVGLNDHFSCCLLRFGNFHSNNT